MTSLRNFTLNRSHHWHLVDSHPISNPTSKMSTVIPRSKATGYHKPHVKTKYFITWTAGRIAITSVSPTLLLTMLFLVIANLSCVHTSTTSRASNSSVHTPTTSRAGSSFVQTSITPRRTNTSFQSFVSSTSPAHGNISYGSHQRNGYTTMVSNCKTPNINGGVALSSDAGKTVVISCFSGFSLQGANALHCVNGSWDAPIPTCSRESFSKSDLHNQIKVNNAESKPLKFIIL